MEELTHFQNEELIKRYENNFKIKMEEDQENIDGEAADFLAT